MKVSQIFWLALGVFTFTLIGCQKQQDKLQYLQPLTQDTRIRVYFNQNRAEGANYIDTYRQITRPGDNLEKLIVDAISSARSSVDVAVFQLNLPKIALALAERQKAGVKVRVILDNTNNKSFSDLSQAEIQGLSERERDSYNEYISLVDLNGDGEVNRQEIDARDALLILRNAGVPIIDDTADGSKGSGLMHHKFVIIDRDILLTGSANFTLSGIHGDFARPETRGNANNLLKIENSGLASIFTEEFNLMWGDGPKGKLDSKFGKDKPYREPQQVTIEDTLIRVQFSPTSPTKPWSLSTNALIGTTLQEASNSINFALFVFSSQKLADILEEMSQDNVKIRGLIDRNFAFRYYSEALDMLGVALSNRCKFESGNNPWQKPIKTVGISQLPQGDKLHHKFAVVDAKTVIAGSHNWSDSANHDNDETLLTIESSTVAAHFEREFERLYESADLGIPPYVRKKIKEQKKQCSQ